MTQYIKNGGVSRETINQIAERFCSSMESCNACSYGIGNELGMDRCLVKQLSMITYPFESITQFLKNWAVEHPPESRKTYADDFLEKCPSVKVLSSCRNKIPAICRRLIYEGCKPYICAVSCEECWMKPIPELDKKG